jgi:hypothetical protein
MRTQAKNNMKLVTLAVLTMPMLAWGQDSDTPGTADQSAISSEITLGLYYLDDPSYRFGKYSGLDEDGVEALADFRIEKRPQWDSGDTVRWSLQGWRLGLDSRRVEFKFHDQRTQSFTADYREIPNNRFSDGKTPYIGAGSDTLTLPDTWVVTPGSDTTSGFASLQESLVNLEVDTLRRRLDLSYDRKFGPAWNLAVDYRHETKKGVRTVGGMFGNWPDNGRSVILPAPALARMPRSSATTKPH